ncbi:LysR family transcriptional regulator [Acidisphaera sp. L21]|uniref:LysR family transcriptional regulator n=1 Tax=Acidisphaera sp. L21 TaxID=1641851 RepID=UPI00131C77DC|nr:LysR family transcriptional regulator [Acidisphaera sp. L21]
MELRHLRYFRMAAEELNITRAAARLGIAQPPLTQQIKALEAELGVALFARIGRRVELTQAGALFLGETRAILARVENATTLARQAGRGDLGRLRVGFTGSAAFNPVVTAILRRYRTTWPGVELVVAENRTSHLLEALEDGRLDAAILRPPVPGGRDLAVHKLCAERMVVAVPVDHKLARESGVTLSALRQEAFILYPRATGVGLSEKIVAACRRAGFDPLVAQESPQMISTINLVAAAIGIAIVPECMQHLRPDGVRFLRLSAPAIHAESVMVRRAKDEAPTVSNLVAAVAFTMD